MTRKKNKANYKPRPKPRTLKRKRSPSSSESDTVTEVSPLTATVTVLTPIVPSFIEFKIDANSTTGDLLRDLDHDLGLDSKAENAQQFQPQLFGGGGAGGGGGSSEPAPHLRPEPVDPTLSFATSMAGNDELIEEVKTRIIFPIVNKDFVERHGRCPPKGILLHGPPGTGKTLFVQVLAAELSRLTSTKYTFFMRRGSDVMSMWVGESEKNLREIFAQATRYKPSILFFDEVDGLAPNRNSLQSSVPVYTNVVTTLLGEMDKVKGGEILVICATNRRDAVDPAMKRPGRCDVHIQFSPPNVNGRKMIIQLYTKTWGQSSPGEKLLNQLAMSTNGFTGADLDKLCSEAFFACVRRSQRSTADLDPRSKSRPLAPSEVKKVNDTERILTSDWHEALSSMQPSQSNVYGSYIKILQISDFIQPLIQNSTKSLVKKLLPHCNSNSGKSIGGPNCFLAWNQLGRSDDILDYLLIPSVFGAPGFSGLTLFVLNEESMLQEHKQFTTNALVDIVKQAKDYPKPCILFVPRIDQLAKRLGGELGLLRKLLFDTASKSVLVLATAGCDVAGLGKDLQPVFDGHEKCWKLTRPAEVERREFFAPIFENPSDNCIGRKGTGAAAEGATTLKSLFEETVKVTDHEDMWSMITLHRELANVRKGNDDGNGSPAGISNVAKQLKEIICAYKEYRLDCSKKC